MAIKKYVWDVYRLEGTSWVYKTSYRSGATERVAFNDFNAYISETLADGNYGCQRRVALKSGKRPTIFVEVWR